MPLPNRPNPVWCSIEMSTVAEILRDSREMQNLSIYDVAEKTKIKTDHIRALEEGRYDVFSAPVFIRGFVRNYSTVLGLDVDEILDILAEELEENPKFNEPPPLGQERSELAEWLDSAMEKVHWPYALALLGALVVMVALYFGIQAWMKKVNSNDPLKNLGSGMVQSNEDGFLLPLNPDRSSTTTNAPLPLPTPY